MSAKTALAAAAVAAGLLTFDSPAMAWGDLTSAPEVPQVVTHRVYRPYYQHVYRDGDPYAYRYVRRAWYPNYNSGYWVPAAEMRYRYRYTYTGPKYRYHPAWGIDEQPPRACAHGCRPAK